MAYKLKSGPAQGLKLKGNAGFALPLIGGPGIATAKIGGLWHVYLDYSEVQTGSTVNDATSYVLTWDSASGLFTRLNVTDLKAEFEGTFDGYYQPLDATLTALAALDSTAGLLAQTGADTFARRTLTGTANEITVTNGDGVSGNPTLSLSAALTFTGKTVTGGTFDGLTITTSTYNGNTWTAGTGTLTLAAGKTLTASDNATVSGTNTGDQTITLTGDITGSGTGSFAATIGATKVTSAMLNADVFSTAHTWSGQQTFVAPILGTPASGIATNLTGTASGLTAGHVTTNANLTGDVTSVGNASTIAANAVTNAKLATAADGTIKSNISGATATPSDNTITAVLDKLFGTTQGSVIYRGASSWSALTPGTSGNFLKTQGAAGNPVWDSIPGGGDMLSTNNLSDVASASTSLTNLGGTTVGKALFTATDEASARTTLGYKWEPITQDAVTNVASWSATGLSAYRMLRLSLKLRSAVNDAFINFRTSSNNGSSYDATVGDYLTSNLIGNASTATSGGNSESALTLNGSGSTAPLAASHIITLFDFNQAEYCFMQSQGFAISSSNVKTVEMRGAARAQATARNAIQVTLSSGNIATGIFILEGVKG